MAAKQSSVNVRYDESSLSMFKIIRCFNRSWL